MILKSLEVIDAKTVRAVILSDQTPASLKINGSDVDGLADDMKLAAGSMIIAPDADYIAFEEPDSDGDTTFAQKYNTAPAEG